MPRDSETLRAAIQRFVREFGLLDGDQTPCGTPLSPSYAHALMVLTERAERPTQAELGATLGIDKSNVARLCARMEAAGHIAQERCPDDGRARRLALTAAGRKLAARVEAASRDRFERLLAALPEDTTRGAVLAALEALNGAIVKTRRKENDR